MLLLLLFVITAIHFTLYFTCISFTLSLPGGRVCNGLKDLIVFNCIPVDNRCTKTFWNNPCICIKYTWLVAFFIKLEYTVLMSSKKKMCYDVLG